MTILLYIVPAEMVGFKTTFILDPYGIYNVESLFWPFTFYLNLVHHPQIKKQFFRRAQETHSPCSHIRLLKNLQVYLGKNVNFQSYRQWRMDTTTPCCTKWSWDGLQIDHGEIRKQKSNEKKWSQRNASPYRCRKGEFFKDVIKTN